MRVALDTSAYIDLHGRAPGAPFPLDRATEVLLPAIVVGELLATPMRQAIEDELRAFLAAPGVRSAAITEVTADYYARIHGHLRRAGTPIPTHDIWIAASAMEHGAVVLTSDRHFLRIPQVLVELL